MTVSLCLRRAVWPALILAASAPAARADAFLEPVGSAKLIVTSRFEDGGRAWSSDGKLRPVAAYRKFTLSATAEYGVAEDLTLIMRADGGFTHGAGGPQHGSLGLGGRYALLRRGGFVLSAEAFTAAGNDADAPPDARSTASADVRLAAGQSFEIAGLDAFATLSAGARSTPGATESRLDATLGLKAATNILLLAQSFNRWSAAGELRSHKIQGSVVWSFTRDWSVQAGVYGTIAGRGQGRPTGVLTALWRRF